MNVFSKELMALLSFLFFIRISHSDERTAVLTLKARKLPSEICGIPSDFAYKIFNGTHATEGAYPWMVAIGYVNSTSTGGTDWFCGGTLITDQYVVTAARCVDPKDNTNPERLVVRLADLNLDDSRDDKPSTENKVVEKVTVHPQYYTNNLNDIALIKLKTSVVYDRLKKPLCLPNLEFNQNRFVDEAAMVTGWGKTEYGRGRVLNELAVEIKDNDICKNYFTKVWPDVNLDDRVVCASTLGKEPCNIDSGGPLMILRMYKGNPRLYLLGVVSHAYDCTSEGHPGIFVRVRYFMDWIVQNLEFEDSVSLGDRSYFVIT